MIPLMLIRRQQAGNIWDRESEIHVHVPVLEWTGRMKKHKVHKDRVASCEYNKDGTQLLTSSHDRTGKLLSVADKHFRPIVSRKVPGRKRVKGATYLLGESRFIMWRSDRVYVCSCDPRVNDDPVNITTLRDFYGTVKQCVRNPVNENIIGISSTKETLLYDISTQRVSQFYEGGSALAFSEDGNVLYHAGKRSIIRSDRRSPRCESTVLAAVSSKPKRIAIHDNYGRLYYSCGSNVYGYDLNTESRLFKGTKHNTEVNCIDVQKDGQHITSSCIHSTIVWDGFTGKRVAKLYVKRSDYAYSTAISPSSSQIVIGSANYLNEFKIRLAGDNRMTIKNARKR